MKDLKVLKLSIPTLDNSECKTLMGGDGYGCGDDVVIGGDLQEFVETADGYRPDHSDYDYQDDILDDEQNDYDYNYDGESENGDSDTSLLISEKELSKLVEGMEKTLADKIVEAWEKGLIVKGDGSRNSPAYFDQGEGKIFINDLSVDSTVMAHEFTHYLQNELGMMGDASDYTGSANLELEANLIQAIMDFADGMYSNREWFSGEHDNNWIINNIDQDPETGVITIDEEFWDWLNDSDAMNDFLDVWLDYWNNNPNSSDIYTEGAQDNWDYNWEQIFDQLGIEHP